jgi:hypothetical protein
MSVAPPLPPRGGQPSSSSLRDRSLFAKAISKLWMWFMSAKKSFLRTSGTFTRRCRWSSTLLSSALLRHNHSSKTPLPHLLQPRWSSLAWTLPALRLLMLGASVPPPPSLTPMMRLKKKTVATMVTMRMRTTSSSCYYCLFFSFFGVLMPKGEK